MIIQCDKCNTKFKLDDSRVAGGGVKVRCTKCQNVFLVSPQPQPEAATAEAPSVAAPEGIGGAEPGPMAGKPKGETANLKFDFERPEQPGPKKEPSDAGQGTPPAKPFGAIGETGVASAAATGAADDADEGAPSAGEGGFDFRFDADEGEAEDKKALPSAGAQKYPDFSLNFKIEAEKGPETAEKKEAPFAAPARNDAAARRAATPSLELFGGGRGGGRAKEEMDEDDAGEEEREPLKGEERTFPAAQAPYAPSVKNGRVTRSRTPKLIALAVIIIGAALYFTGALSVLKGKITGPSETMAPVVEIGAVNGFFAENRFAGKVFVIESRVRNATDEPQKIRRVKGTIYNSEGAEIASRDVSPGRVLSADEIKNLPEAELQKQFKDPSGGLIPPRETLPVMVLFTGAPEGIAEYGIDIVR